MHSAGAPGVSGCAVGLKYSGAAEVATASAGVASLLTMVGVEHVLLIAALLTATVV